jgi:hypothetical protein
MYIEFILPDILGPGSSYVIDKWEPDRLRPGGGAACPFGQWEKKAKRPMAITRNKLNLSILSVVSSLIQRK